MANDTIPAGKAPQNVAGWTFSTKNNELAQLLKSDSKLLVLDFPQNNSIASQSAKDKIVALHQAGKETISYLSIGESEDFRPYYQSSWNTNPPSWMGKENPEWPESNKVKYWDPEWQKIVFNSLDKIIESGFDGIYLDIVDGYDYWSNPNNGEGLVLNRQDAAQRMIDFISSLTEYARVQKGKPNFYIIPQNGEELVKYGRDDSYIKNISGVGIESLFYRETSSQSAASIKYRSESLDKITAAGKPVLVIDYVNDGSGYQGNNQRRIDDFWSKATKAGYVPQISATDRSILAIDPLNAVLAGIVGQTAAPITPVTVAPTLATPAPQPVVTASAPVVTPAPQPVAATPAPAVTPDPQPVATPAPVVTPAPPAVAATAPVPAPTTQPLVEPLQQKSAAVQAAPIEAPAIAPNPDQRLLGSAANDVINGGAGADYLAGNRGNDVIRAGAGNDIVYGEWGRDYIDGGDGNDILWGNDNNDTLLGGAGDDRLVGDRGNDQLTGGAGQDIFVYENFVPRTLGRDEITDFEVGVDRIELHLNIFSRLSPGQTLKPEEFAIVNSRQAAASSSALVVYDATAGNLFYNSNGSDRGFGEGANIANLSNRPNLTAADFILV
jgi:cysteinyl-tRNA synthetase, unknown class